MIRKEQRFFITDYETTGVDPSRDLPIEIGIIITDSEFNLLETYDTLIKTEIDPLDESWLKAYAVHKIEPSQLAFGKDIKDVNTDLINLTKKYTTTRKPIMISDNIQFEWAFTQLIMGNPTKYFHYCGWDSSLLLEATNVGDPIAAHRALRDAGLLHAALIKAMTIIKSNI